MMRRARALTARWNAASEAARRWRIALGARSAEPESEDSERHEKKTEPRPRRKRGNGGKKDQDR